MWPEARFLQRRALHLHWPTFIGRRPCRRRPRSADRRSAAGEVAERDDLPPEKRDPRSETVGAYRSIGGRCAIHARGSKSGRSAISRASTGSTRRRRERASCSNAARRESSVTDPLPSSGSPGGGRATIITLGSDKPTAPPEKHRDTGGGKPHPAGVVGHVAEGTLYGLAVTIHLPVVWEVFGPFGGSPYRETFGVPTAACRRAGHTDPMRLGDRPMPKRRPAHDELSAICRVTCRRAARTPPHPLAHPITATKQGR